MTREAIHAAIPHRGPMLLVDEIVEQSEGRIVCRKTFRADEFFFQGHYPDFPIVLETYRQCLQDVFDLPALRELLAGL